MSFSACASLRISRLFLRSTSMNPALECLLQSVSGQSNDVKVTASPTFIGRTPETEIEDVSCSRKQVKIEANLSERIAEITAQGLNSSSFNGQVMERGKIYKGKHGDTIEIISGKYQYKILFTPDESSAKVPGSAGKRKSEDEVPASSAKVAKIEVKSASLDAPDGKLVYVWTSQGVTSSSKIASYDIDGTIIATKSGNVFPKNPDDWKLAFTEVPGMLKKYHVDGYKVVFFTNQAGIGKGKVKVEDFVGKVKRILAKINIPVQVFISSGKGVYRKPNVGMWRLLEEQFNDGIEINMQESFFVGDAAGREAAKGRKKDHSCSDRLMALNLDLRFLTPEEHFLKAKPLAWVRPEFDAKNYTVPKNALVPAGAKLTKTSKEMIVMVGSPGSGKSSFVTANYQGTYDIVSRDKLGTWQKCVAAAEKALQKGKSVVVDNTNPDAVSRKRYTDLAKKLKCPCRCFLMTTSSSQARHQIAFRELVDPSHTPINDMVFNTYKSKFREPTVAEGFEEIVKVNVIPKFKEQKHQTLYRMYLLDK